MATTKEKKKALSGCEWGRVRGLKIVSVYLDYETIAACKRECGGIGVGMFIANMVKKKMAKKSKTGIDEQAKSV